MTGILPSVQAMLDDPRAPTAPLIDFLKAEQADDNLWWRVSCGHHLNLFQMAIEALGEVLEEALGEVLDDLEETE